MNSLAKKDFPAAIAAAKSYQFRDIESLAPYYVLGRVYVAAGQPEEAKKVFEQILKRKPGDPSASLSLAQLALEAKDLQSARKIYKTILAQHPDDLATLMQLAAIEARERNAEAMVARLKRAIEAHPTALEPRLRLASYYLAGATRAAVRRQCVCACPAIGRCQAHNSPESLSAGYGSRQNGR